MQAVYDSYGSFMKDKYLVHVFYVFSYFQTI